MNQRELCEAEAEARAMPRECVEWLKRHLTPEQFAEMARLRGAMTVDAALVAACKTQDPNA